MNRMHLILIIAILTGAAVVGGIKLEHRLAIEART